MTEPTRRAFVERRIWRLAYLLSGDPAGAAALVDRVLHTRPDALEMEPARLDRLVIQEARETPRPAGDVPSGPDEQVRSMWRALLGLPEQPREAWVLTRIDGLDELHVSRTMDCSRTAARNHLAAADEQVRTGLGAAHDPAIEAMRAFVDGLNPAPIIAAHRAQRRSRTRRRLLMIAAGAGIILLLAAYAALKVWT